MLKRAKHIRWTFVILLVVTVGILLLGNTVLAAELECKPTEIKLNIPFGKTCVTDIADYVSILYRYMVGAIGIVGVAMIMYGGIRWVASNGNSKEVDEAKQTIISAIIGVGLALGSYVLLNFLNPMITQLSNPLQGHTISGIDTTVFCKDKLGSGWQQKVKLDSEEKCGNVFTEISGGATCTSDTCAPGQICHHDRVNNDWKCETGETICESANADICAQVDAEIARLQPDQGCAQRYNDDFISSIGTILNGFQDPAGCVYGDIIKPPDATWKMVSCTTPAALHVCYEKKMPEGQDFPLNCAGPIPPQTPFEINRTNYGNDSRPCVLKDRPVSGADGVCMEKNVVPTQYDCVK